MSTVGRIGNCLRPRGSAGLRCENARQAVRLGWGARSDVSRRECQRSRVGTMTDILTWSPISLGRWFGTTVRVHISLIIFVAFWLLVAAVSLAGKGELNQLPRTACWLGLLLIALAVHELAHAMTAAWLDCDQEDVHVWPLGSLVGPSFVPRSSEHFLVALAGPVASGAIFLGCAVGVSLCAGAQFVWNPFGNEGDAGAGVPRLASGVPAPPFTPVWIIGWFGYLNSS